MNNENLQIMIERYKKQLLEFSQRSTAGSSDYYEKQCQTQRK
jgi:hypothetical protein